MTSSNSTLRRKILARMAKQKLLRQPFSRLRNPEVLRPADLLDCHPALFEVEQLDRIKTTAFSSTLYDEIAKLTTTQFIEAPLERYNLGPSVIAGGRIFTEEDCYFFGDRSSRLAMQSPLQEIGTADLVSSEQGVKYFGHWLRDDCTLYALLREQGKEPWAMVRPDWPDARIYESAFDQDWRALDFAHVSDLTVYREQRFNRDKARRIHQLRDKMRATHPNHEGGHIVYLSRGSSGSPRNMSNAEAFEEAMVAAGIKIVDPGSDPSILVPALLNARMIVTIEGSQAAHGVYMLENAGAMLILQPPERFYNPHHEWARLIGMRYGTVIGTKDETSFHIEPTEVLAMVDRLLAAPRDLRS